MGYGMTAAADGRWFPWVFNFPTTYWSQASAFIRYIGQQEGGLDKLKGKKIVHIFHNSPYGKEANPTLEELAKKYGFELTLLAGRPSGPGAEGHLAAGAPAQSRLDLHVGLGRDEPGGGEGSGRHQLHDGPLHRQLVVGQRGRRGPGRRRRQGLQGRRPSTPPAPTSRCTPDIVKHVYDKGKGAGKKEEIGEVLYNRGIVNAMFDGRGHPHRAWPSSATSALTARAGALGLREPEPHRASGWTQLGMKGFTPPVKVTCEDHEGNGPVLIQQWDGKKWDVVSDWVAPMRDVVRPEARGGGGRGGQEAGLHHAGLLEGEVGPRERPSETSRPLLAVNNIEVIYDHVILVLKGVSLQVPEGGIVALLGANGAGKSTTLKAISGLLRTERGEVTKGSDRARRRGRSTAATPPRSCSRGVVQVMEGRHVFEHLTVEENLLDRRLHPAQRARRCKRDLDLVYTLLPAAARSGGASSAGLHLGRRAADARHRAGPHGASAAHAAGRAVDGAGPHAGGRRSSRS